MSSIRTNLRRSIHSINKECIIIEENKLPEAILVIPNPIPRINNGGISPKLKWANAKINAETMIPEITPKSLAKVGSKIPRNTISSNRGANIVVVTNNRKNDK